MKCFRWSHLICFLFSVERWADSEPPSEKAAAEQHANGKLMINVMMIMMTRWQWRHQYHDYESHNHRHHHRPRQIGISRVHWLIEGSCLWYKHDSQKASSPIAGLDGKQIGISERAPVSSNIMTRMLLINRTLHKVRLFINLVSDHRPRRHLREERDDGEPSVLGSVQRGRLQQGPFQQPRLQVGDRAPPGPRTTTRINLNQRHKLLCPVHGMTCCRTKDWTFYRRPNWVEAWLRTNLQNPGQSIPTSSSHRSQTSDKLASRQNYQTRKSQIWTKTLKNQKMAFHCTQLKS